MHKSPSKPTPKKRCSWKHTEIIKNGNMPSLDQGQRQSRYKKVVNKNNSKKHFYCRPCLTRE